MILAARLHISSLCLSDLPFQQAIVEILLQFFMLSLSRARIAPKASGTRP
jgi:hypothetical protein